MMQFKLVGKTGATTTTPILLNFDVRGILYPERRDIIFCTVIVAKYVRTKDGFEINNKYADQKSCLENARDSTANWPITITDIDGTTDYVKFLPLPQSTPWKTCTKKEKGRDIEWEFNLLMARKKLS